MVTDTGHFALQPRHGRQGGLADAPRRGGSLSPGTNVIRWQSPLRRLQLHWPISLVSALHGQRHEAECDRSLSACTIYFEPCPVDGTYHKLIRLTRRTGCAEYQSA